MLQIMRTFEQLSYHERIKIYNGICSGLTQEKMAFSIGRPKSTVSREIRRNSDNIGYLYPRDAHELAKSRRNKNIRKLNKNKDLQKYVESKLKERWSPGTIAGSWNAKNDSSITKEAIYSWIYADENPRSAELKKLLIRARKRRGLKRKPSQSKIKDRISVHTRPDAINDRSEVGHYEGDLIFNNGSQSKNVCTLIERVTRRAILIRNEDKRSSTVIGALIEHIKTHKLIVKSITFDNGSEFSEHAKLREIGIDTYFCDPGAPWQKGGIENLNGLLRRFLPFKMDADEITQDYVGQVNIKINSMPRAILGYKSPDMLMKQVILNNNKKESRVKSAMPAVEANIFNQNELAVAFHY